MTYGWAIVIYGLLCVGAGWLVYRWGSVGGRMPPCPACDSATTFDEAGNEFCTNTSCGFVHLAKL
jgi:hypothetical protein